MSAISSWLDFVALNKTGLEQLQTLNLNTREWDDSKHARIKFPQRKILDQKLFFEKIKMCKKLVFLGVVGSRSSDNFVMM